MKKIIISVISVAILGAGVWWYFASNNNQQDLPITPSETPVVTLPKKSVDMCYLYSEKKPSGFYDKAYLSMKIIGDTVSGEYSNLPAETDSKTGSFFGTVGPMIPEKSARLADVSWKSLAEGMNVTEQLHIEFGEGSAVAFFGEMIDRGDGVYVYKDLTKLTPGFQMSQINCESLLDIILVEKYIRENIQTIAPDKPVLGGSWYVTNVQIMPITTTGVVNYEDGHIQSSFGFKYIRADDEIKITPLPYILNKKTTS